MTLPWNSDEAKRYVLEHVRVDRADVADAKGFLSGLSGVLYVRDIAKKRADDVVGPPEPEMPLWQDDPTPALDRYARHLSAQLAVCKAAWELALAGVMLPVGTAGISHPTMGVTTVRPGGGGYRGGEQLKEIAVTHPEYLVRPSWIDGNSILADGDLYLRTLDAAGLHAGIAEVLRQSVRCFANGLYVPCVAMLDSASEGAWVEAGTAIAAKPPNDAAQGRLQATLADPRVSMRSKASAVCDYWDTRKDLQTGSGVLPAQLRDTLQWSGLVRDSRNVLHWNVAANIPNDYSKVATLLLAAINHVKRLHLVATA